ncbi:MAG TPA: conjugative transposon protein TraJ [Niabella sp.]|nr:conjugative transposon protein TraJ [Niabella sp.]HQX21403.1 conjugative transposon protein TraJ [Niabella sp.]HQX73328.1 conjugative transposon protein TraJ [Chitinophagaceae bacterium]HRB36153.1 conjugative transposon protein TraJ [Niabella sp.]HRB79463.1 conjugative transposon protein TraJ [Niabella sp.]
MIGRVGAASTLAVVGMLLPLMSQAQTVGGWADDLQSFHSVLDQLYAEMLPLCGELIGVGRGIAGFAALWYIAARVWGHISRTESIDFYPLFKPFIIGFAVAVFPSVIGLINGVMQPTVSGTKNMVTQSDAAIEVLLKQKEEAIQKSELYQIYVGPSGEGDRDRWYKYMHPGEDSDDEGWMDSIGNDIRFAMAKAGYNFRNGIKEVIAEVLQLLFAAASLAINTMRTFNLLIMAILGPLAFGLSVFDGFGHTLKHWLARYINVFLWLPIANLFGAVIGKIQEQMLKIDIAQVTEQGDTFFSRTDMGYMIFLIIGILGYFSVPSIANQILWVGGGDSLTGRTTGSAMAAGAAVGSAAGAATARAVTGAGNLAKAPYNIYQGYTSKDKGSSEHLHDKVKGNK